MLNFEWYEIFSALLVSLILDQVISLGLRLKIDSPQLSLPARITYGIYVTAIMVILLVVWHEGTLSYGDMWGGFSFIMFPIIFLIIFKGSVQKSSTLDPTTHSLGGILENKNKNADSHN